MKNTRIILIWVLGLSFIVIGILKYASLDDMSKSVFDRANYPRWMYLLVGAVEFVAGVLLLLTAATSKRVGSILIGLIMMGAIGTRIIIGDPLERMIIPGLVLVMAILISFDFELKKKS